MNSYHALSPCRGTNKEKSQIIMIAHALKIASVANMNEDPCRGEMQEEQFWGQNLWCI